MRNKMLRALSVLSVTMAVVSCRVALETDFQNVYEKTVRRSSVSQMVLVAMQETPDGETKTALSGSQVLWNAGDQIKVFNATHPEGVVFTLKTESAGQSVGEFSGDIITGDGPFYAVYPASAAGTLSGTSVSVTVPQVQTLTAGSFGNGANLAMTQVSSLSDALHFKNVLGAVCLQLTSSMDATRIRIQTKGTEPLWGSGTVEMAGDIPSLSLEPGTTDHQIVEATGSASGTAFYLMLPPNALASGFMVQLAVGDNAMLKEAPASESNKISRSGIVAMPAFTYQNQLHTAFLDIKPLPFGYYSGVGENLSYQTLFGFDKATSQYATQVVENTSRTFRLQDFSVNKMYSFKLPYTLELGGEYSATLESVSVSTYVAPTDQGHFRLVQKTSKAGWFIKDDNTFGFIIPLED